MVLLRATAGVGHSPQRSANPFDIDRVSGYVNDLESLGYEGIVLADSLDATLCGPGEATIGLEAFTQASYLAVTTDRVGVTVTVNTNYVEPFGLARLLASLDHISHGRASWLISTDESGFSAYNHLVEETPLALRRERRDEAVSVIEGLFSTWEGDAFLRDKQTGAFVDSSKIRALDHKGRFFSVRGPLNVARPPQERLPRLLQVGPADRGDETSTFIGYDVLIVSGHDDAEALTLKKRLAEAGGAQAPRLLKRVVPVLDGISAVNRETDLEHLTRTIPEADLLIGSVADWRSHYERWSEQDSPWDGILIEPAPADYLNRALAGELAAIDGDRCTPERLIGGQ